MTALSKMYPPQDSGNTYEAIANLGILACENGKDVTVIMELRARFDEQNNIDWASRLEKAGCRVIYGSGPYKVHAKICLITKRTLSRVRHITHIGTGNYNEKTAELYTDLSLLTSNEEIGLDAMNFFRNMDLNNLCGEYKRLLVAPYSFKSEVIGYIEREIATGKRGAITIKVNSITDKDMIDKLAEASRAGVRVRLIVRGICCILPGIPGATENIAVMSIVGRFLEHSRIYAFGEGEDAALYISSADFMTRNTERRVEIACPILDKRLAGKVRHMLELIQRDTVNAYDLQPDGSYTHRVYEGNAFKSQDYFIQEAKIPPEEYPPGKTSGLFARIAGRLNLFMEKNG